MGALYPIEAPGAPGKPTGRTHTVPTPGLRKAPSSATQKPTQTSFHRLLTNSLLSCSLGLGGGACGHAGFSSWYSLPSRRPSFRPRFRPRVHPWNKASGLMSNVYGGRKMPWLASLGAICAVTMWPGQVRGGGRFNRAWETHPLWEIYTRWQILGSFLPLKLSAYCRYPGKGE